MCRWVIRRAALSPPVQTIGTRFIPMSGTAALAQRYKKRYTNSIWTIPLEGASPMRDGFIKIAAATPDLHVADCAYNTSEIVKLAKEAAAKGAKLITFPRAVPDRLHLRRSVPAGNAARGRTGRAEHGLPRDRRACGCHRSRSAAARARQAVQYGCCRKRR